MSAALQLFANNGFRGASVREICNLADANPGAVSYHFGGKRQLYRTVLRQAAQGLAFSPEIGPSSPAPPSATGASELRASVSKLFWEIRQEPLPARLVLRDLADGGAVALEALAPPLRAALTELRTATGHEDTVQGGAADRLLFLELAAPLFLLTAAWPVLEGALELDPSERDHLLAQMVDRVLARLE